MESIMYDWESKDRPLWDADPDVCCAAFQLGACVHTEGDNDLYDIEADCS